MKNFIRKLKFLFILPIFFNSCAIDPKKNIYSFHVTPQDYACLEKFFRYWLFYEGGIYTLLGSKPITEMHIAFEKKHLFQLTHEELDDLDYFELNRDAVEDMHFYKSLPPNQKKKAILISGKDFIYNIDQLWNQWENIQHKFPRSKKFLLIKKERPMEEAQKLDQNVEKIIDVMFVNIFQTALVMQKHYDLFKRAVGFDFDPLQIVFELENKDSEFWDKIRGCEHSYLWGLLYGFGEKNTWGYFWKGRNMISAHAHKKEIDFVNALKNHSSCTTRPSSEEKHAFSIANFPIPPFASFSTNDPIIIQYEKEKKTIQDLYRGKDFVDFTLELLFYQ